MTMHSDANAIAILEDCAIYRAGLAALLAHEMPRSPIVEHGDWSSLIGWLHRGDGVALLIVGNTLYDARPPALAAIRARSPRLRIAIMAQHCSREAVIAALADGVHGYVTREMASGAIVAALHAVADGAIHLPPQIADQPVLHGEAPDDQLTTRQRQVLTLLSRGCSNKEIARTLGIAEATVKAHVASSFRTLRVHNRMAAASKLHLLGPGASSPERYSRVASAYSH
ncbi:response regulator transcription factor [Sphingomonas baiyangensis]|nr:response regulator transcription factor [Sphingomonas baiyangensis]